MVTSLLYLTMKERNTKPMILLVLLKRILEVILASSLVTSRILKEESVIRRDTLSMNTKTSLIRMERRFGIRAS